MEPKPKRKKLTIAIDAKELSKKHIGSLGIVLNELLPRLSDYHLILLSDIEIPEQYIPSNAEIVIRNKPYAGGSDLAKYEYWIKKKCEEKKADWYYQINHFSLFKIKGAKQIVVVHDLYALENIEKKSEKLKLTYWLSLFGTMINADTIFTVSRFTKHRLQHFFWKSKKITVNYNGIAEPRKIDGRKRVETPFFLMLGRVSYWKGTVRVAELFEKYYADGKYHLIIAGNADDENSEKAIREITKRTPKIEWLNYVEDDTRDWLLQNADLFIYASRYDGFGKPPLEAAIVKTPCLINDIPVLREATRNKGNYVDFYGEDDKVHQAIEDILTKNDKDQIDQMYRVAKSYTWDKFAKRTIDVIEKAEK